MQKTVFENHSEKHLPDSENRASPMQEEFATDMHANSADDSFKEDDNGESFHSDGEEGEAPDTDLYNGENYVNGDKKEFGHEFENNYSADTHTAEPQSETLDNHRESSDYAGLLKDKAAKAPKRKASKSQGAQLYQNLIQKEKNSLLGKGKSLKKNSKSNAQFSSKSQASKLSKNQNLHQKGTGGKYIKSSAYANGNVNLAPTESSKKKYAKTQSYKTYNELVQIMQSMSKFDWIEAAGITNKSQLIKILSPHAFWFMICTNYFPKHAFTHKNNKEFIHREFDHLRNFTLDVPQRIPKDHKLENVLPQIPDELEAILTDAFSKAIKYSLDTYRNNDYLKRVMSSRTVNTVDLPDYTLQDEEWMMETRRYIYDNFKRLQEQGFLQTGEYDVFQKIELLNKIDLQDLTTLYEKEYYELSLENEERMKELEKGIFKGLAEEESINRLNLDLNDSLVDLRLKFHENTAFIDLLEKKKNEYKDVHKKHSGANQELKGDQGRKTMSRNIDVKDKHESAVEDSVCQVCNGEDYNDDDLIVFCSRCNISVHQKCYGIQTIPDDDWICDLCLNFAANGKYMRCPLCSNRGGALKPTTIRADSNVFETLNPTYHAFMKSYVKPDLFKNLPKKVYQTQTHKPKEIAPEEIDLTKIPPPDDDNDKSYLENLYYNFHLLTFEFTEEELQNEPQPVFLWAHITCAMFIPGVYFSDDINKTNISGIERIDRQRFKHECLVCRKAGCGATINCAKENCKKAFHPECARRARFCLDVRETDTNVHFYHIYCKKHTPLKLKRILESRENKIRDDLDRFFKTIEKYYATYVSENQHYTASDQTPQKDPANKGLNKKKLYLKDDRAYFLKLVEKYRDKYLNLPCTITLEKAYDDGMKQKYGITDMTLPRLPPKRDRKLTIGDEIWAIMPYKNYTPEQKYDKYRKILTKLRKKHDAHKEKPVVRNFQTTDVFAEILPPPVVIEKPDLRVCLFKFMNEDGEEEVGVREIEPIEKTYCICDQPYHGEFMLGCETCDSWYHPECVGGFPPDQNYEKIQKWWCDECGRNMGHNGAFYILEKDPKQAQKRASKYKLEDEPIKKIKGLECVNPSCNV